MMKTNRKTIFIGDLPHKPTHKTVQGGTISLLGELFYKIQNYDGIEPFFMSLASSSDHWLFISSTGGLTAGRGSAEQSLFPYYTEDKVTENSENTGAKAILLVNRIQRTSLWEPFSSRQQGCYSIERNLYKNMAGTALVFEEINLDLELIYRYAWRTSDKFGFVKTVWLLNQSEADCQVEIVDGIQNILPANVTQLTQNEFSVLLDAYKRSEVDPETGLAIFALNSTLTDKAEPSESLLATTVAQVGLAGAGYLLSSVQLERFRTGAGIRAEPEVRGRRCAYFAHATLVLASSAERRWHLIADVCQDSAAIVARSEWLRGAEAEKTQELEADIAAGQAALWELVAGADGLQFSNNRMYAAHHFANVMFNLMRGGSFADQYRVKAKDFMDFVAIRNRPVLQASADFFSDLPEEMDISDLHALAEANGSTDLVRLSNSYLPLAFSRRHGDPSRPWNRFAIHIKNPDGSLKIDYEGNWRDIFQNWEALAYSFPEYIESMISTFLNATTADGYNPYRLTHAGIDWEKPAPGNPWANIGYWSDHQIIYLQKLLEGSVKLHPGKLHGFLPRRMFCYAQVPYQIKPYEAIIDNPYQTIAFDWELQKQIEARRVEHGTDGNLVCGPNGQLWQVCPVEKLLTLLLAKLANFVPEGGIWMNTQRPEWNDANNALVGKGLSVVTLCYLRRFIAFFRDLIAPSTVEYFPLSVEVQQFSSRVAGILAQFRPVLEGPFSDEQRRQMMDLLGTAGSDYRWNFYLHGFCGEICQMPASEIVAFLDLSLEYVEHSLRANQRGDNLFHAYNILHLRAGRATISHLYEMLEGQVAALSSGLLTGEESLKLLKSLRNSSLYQAETNAYLLYPDRDLPRFLEKNCLSAAQIERVTLLAKLVEAGDERLVTRDLKGNYHFNGKIHNAQDVNWVLTDLQRDPRYTPWVEGDTEKVEALFEETFHHNDFTGRSGTFFAYEGLGSVYWHMVGKLLLAVAETALAHLQSSAAAALLECYMEIRSSLGFNKSALAYGAFPTDPYSHTPKNQGAKQPGMSGAVKEEILSRQAELFSVENGCLRLEPLLLNPAELLTEPAVFSYLDVRRQRQDLTLEAGCLAYTICQTPIVLLPGIKKGLTIVFADGSQQQIDGHMLDEANSRHIFRRDGAIHHIRVTVGPAAAASVLHHPGSVTVIAHVQHTETKDGRSNH